MGLAMIGASRSTLASRTAATSRRPIFVAFLALRPCQWGRRSTWMMRWSSRQRRFFRRRSRPCARRSCRVCHPSPRQRAPPVRRLRESNGAVARYRLSSESSSVLIALRVRITGICSRDRYLESPILLLSQRSGRHWPSEIRRRSSPWPDHHYSVMESNPALWPRIPRANAHRIAS